MNNMNLIFKPQFRGISQLNNLKKSYKLLTQDIGLNILDYGTGKGYVVSFFSDYLPNNSHIKTYNAPDLCDDFDYSLIKTAEDVLHDNNKIDIIYSIDEIFDSITLFCMLHDNKNLVEKVNKYLKKDGTMHIFDHDKSHLSKKEFNMFLTDADTYEINDKGYDHVFEKHREITLDNCIDLCEENNITPLYTYDHSSTEIRGYPFYIYVGRKK